MTHPLAHDDRRSLQLRALTEVSRALTSSVSYEQVLQLTVDRAANLLGAHAAVLMLSDADGVLTIRASVGIAHTNGAHGHATDESLMTRLQSALGVTSERFLGVPLVVGGQVTGILAVALPESRTAPADEQEWLLSALADQAAVALEKTRLDESGRFRDRLIGIVSHDLRNPINTVLLGTFALLENDALDAYTLKTLTRIRAAGERAERLISDLLDYTQAHLGGGIRVERTANDLGAIARQVADEIEIAHPEHELELVHSGDTRAELDADRMAQVLGNLISNAMSYSAPGSRVRIELTGEETCVSASVHNDGAPIPPERLRDIFEPMQQVNPGAGRAARSVGLGLYIVESIVTSHGGTIEVTSSSEAGTRFTVRIPRRVA